MVLGQTAPVDLEESFSTVQGESSPFHTIMTGRDTTDGLNKRERAERGLLDLRHMLEEIVEEGNSNHPGLDAIIDASHALTGLERGEAALRKWELRDIAGEWRNDEADAKPESEADVVPDEQLRKSGNRTSESEDDDCGNCQGEMVGRMRSIAFEICEWRHDYDDEVDERTVDAIREAEAAVKRVICFTDPSCEMDRFRETHAKYSEQRWALKDDRDGGS